PARVARRPARRQGRPEAQYRHRSLQLLVASIGRPTTAAEPGPVAAEGTGTIHLVRTAGVEPARCCHLRILSPVCLPVPPRPPPALPRDNSSDAGYWRARACYRMSSDSLTSRGRGHLA